jgi:hypothetical protein
LLQRKKLEFAQPVQEFRRSENRHAHTGLLS